MKRTPLKRRRPGGKDMRRLRKALHARSGGSCEVRADGCWGAATEMHHRKLRAQGGGNTRENLLNVCPNCHVRIHAEPAVSYERGWLVRSFDDPGSVPVRLAA